MCEYGQGEPRGRLLVGETLESVLTRCRAGQPDAVAILIKRFQPWAIDFAQALLKDNGLAEDAVQEAFVSAIQRLDQLREPMAFPGWLRQIIRTHASRIARKRRDGYPVVEAQSPERVQSPRALLERKELHEQVRAALRDLPPINRTTAELFYLDERDCGEVADLLQVPTGTVKRRLYDARKHLRITLLGYLDEDDSQNHATKPREDKLPL